MIYKIASGIAKALREAFPEVTKIYQSTVEQGLDAPAFLIQKIDVVHQPRIGGYYQQTYPFDVVYFPSKLKDRDVEARDVWEKEEAMPAALRYIEADGQVLTADNEPEVVVVEGDIHCRVTYRARWAYRGPDLPRINDLNEEIKVED